MSGEGYLAHFEPHGATRPTAGPIPKTRWARTVDGAWIAYQDFGRGPLTLVFMNGLYSHLEVYWELPQFARFMNRLAASVRVLHLDRRGTGLSDRVTQSPTLEARMDDIRAVMDAAGVERAAIYGWGWGAPGLAALFAGTYPDRTVALLIDGWLALRWAPDYPWGTPRRRFGARLRRPRRARAQGRPGEVAAVRGADDERRLDQSGGRAVRPARRRKGEGRRRLRTTGPR